MKYLLLILLFGCASTKQQARQSYVTVVLDGTNSRVIGGNGTGFIKSVHWRQIQGKNFSINNPNLIKTETNVEPGYFSWELAGTDNLGHVGKDTFSIYIK